MPTKVSDLTAYGSAVDAAEDLYYISKFVSTGVYTSRKLTAAELAGLIGSGFIPLAGTASGLPMKNTFEIDTVTSVTKIRRNKIDQGAMQDYGVSWQDNYVQMYANNAGDSVLNAQFKADSVNGHARVKSKFIYFETAYSDFAGAQYLADHSAFFVDRSIPDCEWVLAQVASGGNPPYTFITGTYAISGSDSIIECGNGTFTITLPTAVGVTGKTYNIKKSGTGNTTIATTSSQTIDGVTTIDLNTVDISYTISSNGTNWIIL